MSFLVLFTFGWVVVVVPIVLFSPKTGPRDLLIVVLILAAMWVVGTVVWFVKDFFAVWGGREIAPSEKCSSDQRPVQFDPMWNSDTGGIGMDEFGKERLRLLEGEEWEKMFARRPYKTPDGWMWLKTIEHNSWPGAWLPGFGFGSDSHYYRKPSNIWPNAGTR